MKSITRTHNLGLVSSFTNISKSLVKIFEHYANIRNLLLKLTGSKPLYVNPLEPLIQEIKNVSKTQQRQIKQQNELQLAIDIQVMLKSFLSNDKQKVRKYELYSYLVTFLDVLIEKIYQFIPKNISLLQATEQMLKWKLFLSELNDNKEIIIKWYSKSHTAQDKGLYNSQRNSKYKILTTFTTKTNTPSTAYMTTMNLSPRVIEEQMETSTQSPQRKHSYLKRCQTAKPTILSQSRLFKRQYPINIRCPSAKQVIKKPSYEVQTSLFQQRKANKAKIKKKLFYKQSMKSREQEKSNGGIQIISLKDSMILGMLEKAEKEKLEKQRREAEKLALLNIDLKKIEDKNMDDNQNDEERFGNYIGKTQSSQRRSSVRRLKKISAQQTFNRSFFGKQNLQQQSSSQDATQKDLRIDHQNNHRLASKRSRHIKNCPSYQQQSNASDSSKLKIDIKKNVSFNKKGRISGLQKRPTIQAIIPSQFQTPILVKKSTRRRGLISGNDILSVLDRVDAQLKQQSQNRQKMIKQRSIQFNQKIIAELIDFTEDFQTQYDNTLDIGNNNKKAKTLDNFYRQLKQFKTEQHKKAIQSPLYGDSIFFTQQDMIRQQKSQQLRQYLQKLKSQEQIGQMFDLKCQQSNIKIQNYMAMQRKYAFQSDQEWIDFNLKFKGMTQEDKDVWFKARKQYELAQKGQEALVIMSR